MRGRQQFLCVRVLRRIENVMAGTALDNLAVLYHDDIMGERLDHRQVMTDEQVRQAVLFLKLAQQCDDLFLHGAVQRRGRLVEQNQRGFQHQRPCNGDTLTLATGKLMGVAMPALRVDADFFKRPNDYLAGANWLCTSSPSLMICATDMRGLRLP